MQAGCDQAVGTPVLVSPEGGGSGEAPAPSVSQALAEEAWLKRFVFHVGPVELPAWADEREMMERPLSIRFQTGEDLWVTGFEPRVVDAQGSELPGELLYRAVALNMHESNPACQGPAAGAPFFMADSLMSAVELPQGYGYPLLSSDPIEVQAVFRNPSDAGYPSVSFELTLAARPMSDLSSLTDVSPVLVEFDPCGRAPLEIEPGGLVTRSAAFRMIRPSRVIMVSGALSDYGASVELSLGDEIVPFWRGEASLGLGREVLALSDNPFVDLRTEIAAGSEVSISAVYENSSGSWIRSAYAAAMMYVEPRE